MTRYITMFICQSICKSVPFKPGTSGGGTPEQVTWGDGTSTEWGDNTPVEWSDIP